MRSIFITLLFLCSIQLSYGQSEFITTWQTTSASESITIPTNSSYTYNYNIDWGDGATESNLTGDATHTYTSAGTYTVEVTGTFPAIYFNNSGDKTKILTIEQWGNITWSTMNNAFKGCSNVTINATDAPDLTSVTSLEAMFKDASSVDGNLSNWNVSTITNMAFMFDDATAFNGNITTWNVSNVEDMSVMFRDASTFNQDISSWNTSKVRYLDNMFFGASVFNQDISGWDMSAAENTEAMFEDASNFDQNLSTWDVSNVTAMSNMFDNSGLSVLNYDKTLIGWSALSLQNGVTLGAIGLNYCSSSDERQTIIDTYNWAISGDSFDCSSIGLLTTWQTTTASESITIPTNSSYTYNYDVDWGDGTIESGLTGDATHTYTAAGTYTVEISGTFPAIYFNNNGDKTKILSIEAWGNIVWTSMESAFYGCTNLAINAPDSPDLSGVTTLASMFRNATSLNQDISGWDISNVEDMSVMFRDASSFNQDISSWNTSKALYLDNMFVDATSFNQDISGWDVSSVENLESMFKGASAFNQDLGDWDVSNVTTMANMLDNSGLSDINYDNTLIGWSALTLKNGVTLGANGLSYCNASTERQNIITNFSWTISNDVLACTDGTFVTTWETTTASESITIPTNSSYTYNYDIDWGDGTTESGLTGDATHTYTTAGTYTVEISGTFPAIYFNDGGDKTKILTIEQWGGLIWKTMENAFEGCSNLTINASDAPDLSSTTSLSNMFRKAQKLNSNLNNWDVSNITSMNGLFRQARDFNGNISDWDVSKVTDMSEMFRQAGDFNQNIGSWNTGAVLYLDNMFLDATTFNQDISSWNVSSSENLSSMFEGASVFSQNLGNWDVSNATSMANMFDNSGLSLENYDNTLIGWSALTLQSGVTLGASGMTYCLASYKRQSIIDTYSWTISGDAMDCSSTGFTTTWQTTSSSESITIPTNSSYTYNYNIDWGDGSTESSLTGDATHTYTAAGTYTVEISGTFPAIYFNNGGDKSKILTIEAWGNIAWSDMSSAFRGCNNLTVPTLDAPDLSGVTSLASRHPQTTASPSFEGGTPGWFG